MLPIHFLSVLVAAVAAFIIGFLFHGPVFGKLWMKLANIHPTGNEKFSDMYRQMFWNLVVNIVTAYVLAVVYLFASTSIFTNGPGVSTGIMAGLWVWFGFIVTGSSIEVIWMKRSWKLWLFEVVASLVNFVVMGAIIAGMK